MKTLSTACLRIGPRLMVIALLSGCAFVTIEGASGPQRLINIGPLSLQADLPNRVIVSNVYGAGVTVHEGVLNLGYIDYERVLVLEPTQCNLVVIIKSAREAQQIKQVFEDAIGKICTNL